MTTQSSIEKFDTTRAREYGQQSRIALAGYDACHELSACVLAASIEAGAPARILVVGAGGTGREISTAAALEPAWTFTAVDPSRPMLDLARASVHEAGLDARVEFVDGVVEDLSVDILYDGAILFGVLHHVPGDEGKAALLSAISARLKPKGTLVVAGNYRRYADHPRLLDAWGQRWRMHGVSGDEVSAKLGKILQGADPPESEEALFALFRGAGLVEPLRFFASLFWGAWSMKRSA